MSVPAPLKQGNSVPSKVLNLLQYSINDARGFRVGIELALPCVQNIH